MFALSRRSNTAAQLDAINRSQATIVFALDGTILDANRNFLTLVGYDLDEVRGRHHRIFVDPSEAASPSYLRFWDTLRRGEFQSAEYKRVTKTGSEVWIRATYNPVLDARGRPTQIIKFALDITAEKRAGAEASGQIVAINRSQAVIHFTPDGTIEDVNDHFLSATGYARDEVCGRHHRLFVDADEAASPEYREFWNGLARGEYRAGEFKRLGKNGREIWIQATYNPIIDAEGRTLKVVKYATDITEPKRIAADMAGKIEAAQRSLGVIEFDMDGNVLDANDNFLAVLGYRLDEIKGRHHSLFVEPAYARGRSYAEFWDNLRAGEFSSAIYPRTGKNGREVWIQATYNPVMDLNGRPCKVIKFATDVTASMTIRAQAISSAEQTLSRVQAVALASEEMHRTSTSIADRMLQSQAAMGQIHERMEIADASTAKLGEAAQAMNSVVEAITSIAQQINLLALNATIEAARAGHAGRGFSVVAAEVKNLAGQAQAATGRISSEIGAMQAVSQEVGAVLASIRNAVDDVQGYVSQTVAASEQQRVTTGEVSANVQTTASGVASIARSLDEWLVGVEERRSTERMRTSLPAEIEIREDAPRTAGSGRATRLRCIVLNLSGTGAKLALQDVVPLPETFRLHIEGDRSLECKLVRQSGQDIGVLFTG